MCKLPCACAVLCRQLPAPVCLPPLSLPCENKLKPWLRSQFYGCPCRPRRPVPAPLSVSLPSGPALQQQRKAWFQSSLLPRRPVPAPRCAAGGALPGSKTGLLGHALRVSGGHHFVSFFVERLPSFCFILCTCQWLRRPPLVSLEHKLNSYRLMHVVAGAIWISQFLCASDAATCYALTYDS